MDFIQESWMVFLILGLILVGLLQVIAKNRSTDIQPGMATKSDQFSMKTIFLSVRSGEAPLFFSVLGITVFYFLFVLGFCREVISTMIF